LLTPAVAVIGVVLAYPLYLLAKMSFQKYGLFELIRHQGRWIGTANYARIFHDGEFWHVVLRTAAFTAVCVSLTMVLGTAIALLLLQVSRFMRLALTTGLVLVWAVPVIVAVNIWHFMVDYQFGVLNWTLTKLHIGDFARYDWFANPWTGFAVFTALIVWGAIPFITITVYAALAQVPQELLEAAAIDGARPWADLSRGDDAPADADLRHPHEPVDHLGLPGLPADLGDARLETEQRVLHDGDLRLSRVVPDL
jgi:N,N'-diacetylchitobiose transport system permease protein